MADLRGVGSQPRLQDQTTNPGASALTGTGIFQPLLPNQHPAGDTGGQQGKGGDGAGDPHAALAAAILGMGDKTIARVSTRLANLTPKAQGADNVLRNLNPHGETTFARGSLRPVAYDRQFNKSLMGRTVRVSGDLPSDWGSQITAGMSTARLNRADPAVLARTLAA